jgi:hypothetical protein
MTERDERGAVARAVAAPAWSGDGWLAALLLRDASPGALVALAGALVLAACWAVLSPPIVFSSEMTWDLLFNLSGAWHLRFGHVPHVDFHEPVGPLNFMLTALGFELVGNTPQALPVGIAIVTAFLFGAASLAAWRRLPLLPAVIFVVFACLLVLRPANVGDTPNAYSFAMTYNRYGWSGVSVIALILFLPPRRSRWADIVEMAIVATILVAMFHLKITYFLIGGASIVAALVTSPHVRARWHGWVFVALVGLAMALAPFNQPYLGDLVDAARAGVVRDDAAFFFNDLAENAGQYAPFIAAVGVAAWLWWRGSASIGLPLASAFLLLAALALLSQNSQAHGLPLALVIVFLLYGTLRSGREQAGRAVMLAALLVFPLASIAGSATSVFGYQARTRAGYMRVVDSTNLRGLAVPMQPGDVIADFAGDRPSYRLLSRARAVRPRYELSPLEYVQTLQEAATLLREQGRAHGQIAVLDQVNPLPFMLGLEPPRGGNLWSGAGAPTPTAEDYLGDADHVLIPKFTTNAAWTERAQALYASYLERHFPRRVEGRSWIVLSRQPR